MSISPQSKVVIPLPGWREHKGDWYFLLGNETLVALPRCKAEWRSCLCHGV